MKLTQRWYGLITPTTIILQKRVLTENQCFSWQKRVYPITSLLVWKLPPASMLSNCSNVNLSPKYKHILWSGRQSQWKWNFLGVSAYAMFQFFVPHGRHAPSAYSAKGVDRIFHLGLPAVFPDELHNFLNHKATMHIWAISPAL